MFPPLKLVDAGDVQGVSGAASQGHTPGHDLAQHVLSEQRNLACTVGKLVDQLTTKSPNHTHMLKLLASARSSLDRHDSFFRSIFGPEEFVQYCPPHATGLAQRVFDVPELLEMILLKLDILHLLKIQTVNRQFRDAVDQSLKLQRKMSLVPRTPGEEFYAPFAENVMPGLRCDPYAEPRWKSSPREQADYRSPSSINYTANFGLDLPRIGAKGRRMFIAQPLVTKMSIQMNCCNIRYLEMGIEEREVEREQGFTVGDLLDLAQTKKEVHQNCPRAEVSARDPIDGHVMVRTIFRALVELNKQDPILVALRKVRRKEIRDKDEIDLRKSFASAYDFDTAMMASYYGTPVPDFLRIRKEFFDLHRKRDSDLESEDELQ